MEIEVTLKQLATFRVAVSNYLWKYPRERSVLTFALNKLVTKYAKKQTSITDEVREKIDEANVRLASVKEGNLIENRFDFRDGKEEQTNIRYSYTPEKKIELSKQIFNLNREAEERIIKVEPFYVDIPQTFDWSFYEAFKIFVFKELTEDEELEKYLSSSQKLNENGKTIEPVLNLK